VAVSDIVEATASGGGAEDILRRVGAARSRHGFPTLSARFRSLTRSGMTNFMIVAANRRRSDHKLADRRHSNRRRFRSQAANRRHFNGGRSDRRRWRLWRRPTTLVIPCLMSERSERRVSGIHAATAPFHKGGSCPDTHAVPASALPQRPAGRVLRAGQIAPRPGGSSLASVSMRASWQGHRSSPGTRTAATAA
jgi:hypothetical protein